MRFEQFAWQVLAGGVAVSLCMSGVSFAQGTAKTATDRANEDVAAHRIIARAHENAARCLEAGKGEKACHAELARECQNVSIGKHCGMRHKH